MKADQGMALLKNSWKILEAAREGNRGFVVVWEDIEINGPIIPRGALVEFHAGLRADPNLHDALTELQAKGLIRETAKDRYEFTPEGEKTAARGPDSA